MMMPVISDAWVPVLSRTVIVNGYVPVVVGEPGISDSCDVPG